MPGCSRPRLYLCKGIEVKIKATKSAERLKNRYELSMAAFRRVFKRTARLDDLDHAWIMGWQQGFVDRQDSAAQREAK
jgi:hypothetical protein